MKIGEFAKICGTRISVLRHYDKEKLLTPEHIDIFSGYRHYSSEQIITFHRITALKKAGFSLQEIRTIISSDKSDNEISEMFLKKEQEHLLLLDNLKEAKLMMTKLKINFVNETARVKYRNENEIIDIEKIMENEIKSADYQRISQYHIENSEIVCDVVKLGEETELPEIKIPFENDETVVGKWEILGNYAVKEDFFDGVFCEKNFYGGDQKYIYFLPNGERYWSFSWTKGYFFSPVCNEYEVQEINGELYMFINLKEYEFARGGKPTCLVLKKADSNRYSAESIAKKDNIDMPFVNDKRIIGKWRAHSFLGSKSEFPTEEEPLEDLYFKEIEFFPGGSCRCVYEDDIFEGNDNLVWTKNFLLRKWNWSACEYEIRSLEGIDYMIIEWKSGDYRYGGYDTNYYVFVRA